MSHRLSILSHRFLSEGPPDLRPDAGGSSLLTGGVTAAAVGAAEVAMAASRQSLQQAEPAPEERPAPLLHLGRVFHCGIQEVRLVAIPEGRPSYVMVENLGSGIRWPITYGLALKLAGKEAQREARGEGRVVSLERRM